MNHLLKIRSLPIGLKQYTSVVKIEAVQGLRRPTAYGLSNCHQKPHRQIHHHGHGRQNGSSTPGPRHKASGRVPLFHPAASTTRGVDRARYRSDAEVRAKQIGDRPKRDHRSIVACFELSFLAREAGRHCIHCRRVVAAHRRPVCKEGLGKRVPVQAGHVLRPRPHQDAFGLGPKNVTKPDAILRSECRLWLVAIQFHRDP